MPTSSLRPPTTVERSRTYRMGWSESAVTGPRYISKWNRYNRYNMQCRCHSNYWHDPNSWISQHNHNFRYNQYLVMTITTNNPAWKETATGVNDD